MDTQDQLIAARAEIAQLREATFELNKRIYTLHQAADEREEQLRSKIAAANSTILGITSSKSWRLLGVARKLKLSLRTSLQFLQHPIQKYSEARTAYLFDADFYLRAYPDVREKFPGNPYQHYIDYGRAEGRHGFQPEFVYYGDFNQLKPDRDTVLVVSHEASTTGAPVLSLNIILELKSRYNVIALLLKGGSLLDDLNRAADIVVGPIGSPTEIVLRSQVDQLLSRCKIRFAIVNSAESRMALPELARHFVPAVALVHEFASYLRPENAIDETAFWASETIFSADIVRDSAVSASPHLSRRLPAVIPQGRCTHVLTSAAGSSMALDDELIRKTFRPAGWPGDTPVVLGIGTVNMRKGVDLFISCAVRVSRTMRCRFIWIGRGFDPNGDPEYSPYLEDQIKRAGLTDSFAFMHETSRIDVAYESADVLVVSSRLDPLPNVSIDASFRGLPIVCFDKATGIAEILRQNGLEKECVAPYLDVEELAMRVLAFLGNPPLRQSVSIRLKELAERTFNMSSYVEQVEDIALRWTTQAEQERADCATIEESHKLDAGFFTPPFVVNAGQDAAVRRFVRSWANGFLLRKPFPGFHPGIYREQYGIADSGMNPLAHSIREGSPKGPWSFEVIDPQTTEVKTAPSLNCSVALHLHLFYPELAPIILERLNANTIRPDLFVSFASGADLHELKGIVQTYKGKIIEIQEVPNRGRDIGAFLTAFGDRMTRQYDLIGHFHTKKTLELQNSTVGTTWFSFLLENLIGGRHPMMDTILGRMAADPSIGLVFPDDPYVVGWTENLEAARLLAAKMGMREPKAQHFNFPIGTMFWARSASIRSLIDLNLNWKDYPAEPLPYDGTILHAMERLLPFIVDAARYRSVVTYVPGVTR